MKKYQREEKVRFDKQQLTFGVSGDEVVVRSNEFRFARVERKGLDFNKKVTCPFCLTWMPLSKFIISTKKGYHQGLGLCSECKQKMQLKTLFGLGKWTPEQYAKFVVEYPSGAFFKKIKFEEWKKRLFLMNWSQRFWLEYRRLNPKIDAEEPTDEENDLYNAMLKNTEGEVEGQELNQETGNNNDGEVAT